MDGSLTPLKGLSAGSIDLIILRENNEGLFWTRTKPHARTAKYCEDTLHISRKGSERLFRAAFRLAEGRRRKVTLVDKANVLQSMAYFRLIFEEVSAEYPQVETECVLDSSPSSRCYRSPPPLPRTPDCRCCNRPNQVRHRERHGDSHQQRHGGRALGQHERFRTLQFPLPRTGFLSG